MIVTLSSGPFVSFTNHPLGLVHKYSRWRIFLDTGAGTQDDLTTVFHDSGWVTNLLTYPINLAECENYRYQVQHIDGLDLESLWSVSVRFNTIPALVTVVPTYIDDVIAEVEFFTEEVPCGEGPGQLIVDEDAAAVAVAYFDEVPAVVNPCD